LPTTAFGTKLLFYFFFFVGYPIKKIKSPVNLYAAIGELLDSNLNRSPYSYDHNPEEERAKYAHNTDTDMTLIKIVDTAGVDVGALTWFAVHPTSTIFLFFFFMTNPKTKTIMKKA